MNEELKFLRKFKKNFGGGGGGRGSGGGLVGWGGQGGCERRIEVFVKIQKKFGGGVGSGWGWGGLGRGGGGGGGGGLDGGSGWM